MGVLRAIAGIGGGVFLAWGMAHAQPKASPELDRLTTIAANQGVARVIIGLKVDAPAPSGGAGALPLSITRKRVEQAQKAVEAEIFRGSSAKVLSRFNLQPHLTAEVDVNTLERLKASPKVLSIEEDVAVPLALAESTAMIGAPTAWASGVTGTDQTVAVLDTGVDKTHPMLAGKVVSEACYSTTTTQSKSLCPGGESQSTSPESGKNCQTSISGCSHGTHVAGIVAGDGGVPGTRGVAPGAKVLAIQVFSHFPASNNVMSYTSDQIRALERVFALKDSLKIASVNMSLGAGQYTSACDASNLALKAAIDNLRSAGVATVIASGNSGYTNALSAPACISSAVSVAAHCDVGPDGSACGTGAGGIASYSNVASFVSLVAPGSYIRSSIPGGGYASYNGTSMAAPHVAGAWAQLRQLQPGISVSDGLSLLKSQGLTVNDTRPGGTVSGLKRLQTGGLTATPRTLSVFRSGTGGGIVSSVPGGVLCGGDCNEIFADGANVTLTATPSSGSTFVGWSGACSGTGACTLNMSEARQVTAQFQAGSYVLSVTRSGNATGTVSASSGGILCGSACSATYTGASTVTLTATAGANARFAGWSGACTGTAGCVVSMVAARSVTATFTATHHLLTVSRAGVGTGTVTSKPAGISCGSACTSLQAAAATVTLTAKAASGSQFSGWTGACKGTGTCTVRMSAAVNVGATFQKIPYVLSYSRAGSGSGLVTVGNTGLVCGLMCSPSFASGTIVQLTAAPYANSTFVGWVGACTGKGVCKVTLNAAARVSANFRRK
jgi:subtilisin family serine protease